MYCERVARFGRMGVMLVGALLMPFIPLTRVSAEEATPSKDAKQEGLFPCLAIAADGSPVCPGTRFTPSKRITAAFQLKAGSAAKKLDSRWIALGEQETVIAENSLDLKGQSSGWLRLTLKQAAPPGKYRLDASLDGKPWQSVDIQITAPIEKGTAEKPADLIPLNEGATLAYDLVVRSFEGTSIEVPGVKPDADGARRATLVMSVGKTDDTGTHYTGTINGQPAGEMWVKLDENGLAAVRRKAGAKATDLDPPQMLHPLPPTLEDGTTWSCKSQDNNEQKLQVIGPMMLDGPDGPAAGYLIFSEEQLTVGSPGVPASRGKETVERYYIPKVGLVREVHVNVMSGKLTSRQQIILATGKPYKLVANPAMKGRLGKVVFEYPPDTKYSDTKVAVFKDGAKPDDKPMVSGYGAAAFDLMPGKYLASVNHKRVPIEVKSGHNSIPRSGVLRVHAGSDTKFRLLDQDKKELYSGYGEQDVALPVGVYVLEIAGSSEEIRIGDGQVVDF